MKKKKNTNDVDLYTNHTTRWKSRWRQAEDLTEETYRHIVHSLESQGASLQSTLNSHMVPVCSLQSQGASLQYRVAWCQSTVNSHR